METFLWLLFCFAVLLAFNPPSGKIDMPQRSIREIIEHIKRNR